MNPFVKNGNELSWRLDNMNEKYGGGNGSRTSTCGGIDWKINVGTETVNSSKYLVVNLDFCSDNRYKRNWICDMSTVFKIMNQKATGKVLTTHVVSLYDSDHLRLGYNTFLEWWQMEDQGYIKDNSIIVEIEFDFKYYDFSKNIPNFTDIIFDVENTKFHANKELLCSKSEYFHKMFVVDKSEEKELKIENVKAGDFRYFIASFCFFLEKLDLSKYPEGNYEQLIKLAVDYKTPHFHKNCEKFLIFDKTLQIENKIEYADKYNYDELLKSCADSLTDQIKKLHKSTEYRNMKDTTMKSIQKKIMDNLNELAKEGTVLKCQSCINMDLEENLHICQTCNEQNLKHFKNEEEVLSIAICSHCAIKKHIEQKHVIIDFLPHYRTYKFKLQSEEVKTILESFQQAENIRKDEEQKWKTMNETADIKFNGLVDLTRWSKSTICLQENMDDIKSFVETAKNVNDSLIEVMKTKSMLLQKNLQELEKWIEEKNKECVENEETIKLED